MSGTVPDDLLVPATVEAKYPLAANRYIRAIWIALWPVTCETAYFGGIAIITVHVI
jgi:hypothetical protein